MTTIHEIKTALSPTLNGLRISCQAGRDEVAIGRSTEEADEIGHSSARTVALHSLTCKREMASLVSEALERIENETYGPCAECGERIGAMRLAAIPWAKYCVRCQDAKDSLADEFRWGSAA
jgi:DnaK suppressor protein